MTKKTESQSNWVSSAPETSGPSAEIPPPSADQSAIALVRSGPLQSAVISARVVGKAIPAASPPTSRAKKRTSIEGAKPAASEAGIARAVPANSICLRPWASPSAPR